MRPDHPNERAVHPPGMTEGEYLVRGATPGIAGTTPCGRHRTAAEEDTKAVPVR